MKLTVAYITGRAVPKFAWFLKSLEAQLQAGDDVRILVVDAHAPSYTPVTIVKSDDHAVAAGRFRAVEMVRPKPTIWQGQYRRTAVDWWAMSSARNTAFCLCDTDWIAFCDDRCVLAPGWLSAVRNAVEGEWRVVCGGYEKRHNMADADIFSGIRVAIDNRWEARPEGYPMCGGQWLYGCTFALPLEWALAVNGFEEGCDGLSAEDYIFGMNLANAGYRLDYDPAMWVAQDRSPGSENTFRREDKGVSPRDKSHAALERFGKRSRTEFTPDLRAIRADLASGKGWPIPDPKMIYVDWFDSEAIDHDYPRKP